MHINWDVDVSCSSAAASRQQSLFTDMLPIVAGNIKLSPRPPGLGMIRGAIP
jgi:hypothetical protein